MSVTPAWWARLWGLGTRRAKPERKEKAAAKYAKATKRANKALKASKGK